MFLLAILDHQIPYFPLSSSFIAPFLRERALVAISEHSPNSRCHPHQMSREDFYRTRHWSLRRAYCRIYGRLRYSLS